MATNTIFTNKTLIASLLAIGIAGGAQAQAPSTLDITGHAPGQQVGSVVGGGNGATLLGGGDDQVIRYNQSGAGGGAGWGQAGRFARFASTDGDGPRVEYVAPQPAGPGRDAWLSGGGDDAQVTYAAPDQRR